MLSNATQHIREDVPNARIYFFNESQNKCDVKVRCEQTVKQGWTEQVFSLFEDKQKKKFFDDYPMTKIQKQSKIYYFDLVLQYDKHIDISFYINSRNNDEQKFLKCNRLFQSFSKELRVYCFSQGIVSACFLCMCFVFGWESQGVRFTVKKNKKRKSVEFNAKRNYGFYVTTM